MSYSHTKGVSYHAFSDHSGSVFYHHVTGETLSCRYSLDDINQALDNNMLKDKTLTSEVTYALSTLIQAGFIRPANG